MSSEQKSGPVPLLSLLLALAYLVLRDVASAGGISALLFIAGGIALFALLFGLSDLLLRALPDSHERLYRRLSTVILVGVPAVYTLGLAWTPLMEQSPRTLGLVAGAALGTVAIAEWVLPRVGLEAAIPRLWASSLVASLQLMTGFVYLHVSQQTMVVMKVGREGLHESLFLVTWATCLLMAVPWALRISTRSGNAASGRWPLALGATAIAMSLALLEFDQRRLVGLHPELHQWLELVALLSLDAGLLALLRRFWRRPAPPAPGVKAWAPLVGLVGLALSFVAKSPDALDGGLRAQLLSSAVGPHALSAHETLRGSGKDSLAGDAGHPALSFERYHEETEPKPRHNILLITIDTIRGDLLEDETESLPNLLALAEDCTIFTRAYAPGPRTAIGLGGFMAGRYSAHLQWDLWRTHRGKSVNSRTGSPEELEAFGKNWHYRAIARVPDGGGIVSRAKAAGMRTSATTFAKKNPILDADMPFAHGFDAYLVPRKLKPPVKTPSTPRLVKLALTQIRKAKKRDEGPWLQWLHLFDPHEAKGDWDTYRSMVEITDRGIGKLMAGLEKMGELDNTAIIVVGDHGEGLGDHRFDAHGTALYDEQVRVPMLVCVPGEGGKVFEQPVSTLDAAATLVALSGGDMSGLDGVNLLPLIREERYPEDRPVFLELHRFRGQTEEPGRDIRGVVLGPWKFIYDRIKRSTELYNLSEDPDEENNLVGQEAQRAAQMKELVSSFMLAAER